MQLNAVAAILGGGSGSRIGRRKALVPLAGQPQIAHVAAVLRAAATRLAVVGDADAALALDAVDLTDPPGFPAGPLSGVCAALEWAADEGAEFVMVSPCDTPLLASDVMQQLGAVALSGAKIACAETDDGLQPLVSVWRSNIAPWLRSEMSGGHPSVRNVLANAGFERVKFNDADVFLNVNTPEDLQRAEAILRARRQ